MVLSFFDHFTLTVVKHVNFGEFAYVALSAGGLTDMMRHDKEAKAILWQVMRISGGSRKAACTAHSFDF